MLRSTKRSASSQRPHRRRRAGLCDLADRLGIEDLDLGQVVAHVLVDILPVVADPRVGQLDRQAGHVADGAAFAEEADAGDAEGAHVLVAVAHERLELLVVGEDGVFQQPPQPTNGRVDVPLEVRMLGADDGGRLGFRLPEPGFEHEAHQFARQIKRA